jgi:hypothetical protein
VRQVQGIVSMALEGLRAAILTGIRQAPATMLAPVAGMTVVELRTWSEPWAGGFVDPGGFLAPYRALSATDRARDLLVEDPIGTTYWRSEYRAAAQLVEFRCGFIVHLAALTPTSTDVSIFELTPAVRAGQVWGWEAHGLGIGRIDDIRFVEPTVIDRQQVLAWLQQLAGR